jgi:hypothetical protein
MLPVTGEPSGNARLAWPLGSRAGGWNGRDLRTALIPIGQQPPSEQVERPTSALYDRSPSGRHDVLALVGAATPASPQFPRGYTEVDREEDAQDA